MSSDAVWQADCCRVAIDLDTDAAHANYFTLLLATHKELSPAQFGIYFP